MPTATRTRLQVKTALARPCGRGKKEEDKSLALIIRQATPEDAAGMLKYMKELLSEPFIHLPLEAEEFTTTLDEEIGIINKAKESLDEIFLVAIEKNEVVGLLNNSSNKRLANKHDTSFGITVKKEFRGRGIGRKLLVSFLNWVTEKTTLKSVSLTVWKSNSRAVRLYKSLGFKRCGIRRYAVFKYGKFHPVVTMEKLICR